MGSLVTGILKFVVSIGYPLIRLLRKDESKIAVTFRAKLCHTPLLGY